MIKDDISNAYILALSGSAQYKNNKEIFLKKHTTIELVSATDAVIRKYTAGGKLCWMKSYKNYQLDGKFIEWDAEGNKIEISYKSGKKDGIEKKWFDDGQLAMRCRYKEGKLSGQHIIYYYGSKLPAEVDYYKNGKWLGYKCFGPKGKLLCEYYK